MQKYPLHYDVADTHYLSNGLKEREFCEIIDKVSVIGRLCIHFTIDLSYNSYISRRAIGLHE